MARPKYRPGSTLALTVRNRSGKKPLAEYLASRLGIVLEWARLLLSDGQVRLDGQLADEFTTINLSIGPHELTITFPDAWPRHMAPTPMELDILYEDDHLIVLNKPPGIVVHPARGHLDNQTLQNGLRHRYRDQIGLEGITIGPPHRLDKNTSGVIVFARTTAAYINLVDQFATGVPHKRYLALVDGAPAFTSLRCDSPIGPDLVRKGCGTIVPVEQGGKTARTDFTVIEQGAGWALLEAIPHTGRPHQIRVHAASLGLPLAGDADYNLQPQSIPLSRQGLHALELTFVHPASNQAMRFEAPLPEDMQAAITWLRQSREQK